MDKKYRGIGDADRAIRQGITKGLNNVGADLVNKSVQLAPKKEGTLRGSAEWNLINEGAFRAAKNIGRSEVGVSVTFNVPYAKVQHEEDSYQHSMGQAKYLGEPLRNSATGFRGIIVDEIKKQLRSDL